MAQPATTKDLQTRPVTPVDRLKSIIDSDSVQAQFRNCLNENSGPFVASLIDVYASDTYLQKCEPKLVIMEALKAATLKLPINKQLGFAYIVPYNKKKKEGNQWKTESIPQFQIGYKGYIQLAMRTGQYRYINAGALYEGHTVDRDLLTGKINIFGEQKSDKVIAYFAYMELLNGFSKAVCWTKDEVLAHAKRYSKSFDTDASPWKTQFDPMAIKTMLRNLLSKYGVMSIEMLSALDEDIKDERDFQGEIDQNANMMVIDIDSTPEQHATDHQPEPEQAQDPTVAMTEEEKAAIVAEEAAEAEKDQCQARPGF